MFRPSLVLWCTVLSHHFPTHGQRRVRQTRKGTAIDVMVCDQSMEMDGPCAMYRCMTDGKLENVSFFLDFFALAGLLPAGVMYKFLISVVSIFIRQ